MGKTKKRKQQQYHYEDLPEEKLYPEQSRQASNYFKTEMVPMLDPDEVRRLVEQSGDSLANRVPVEVKTDYPTYTFEEVAALMACNYHPSMFRRKRHGVL